MSTESIITHYLTVSEVADALRLSKMTVYRLIQAHQIPAVRFGNSYRIPETAAEQYIERASLPDPIDSGDQADRGQ